jgi:hypothetical protein
MNSLILKTFAAVVLICAPALARDVDVYLLGGQSNMEGQGAIADLTKVQKQFSNEVYFWNGKDFESLTVGKTMTSNRPERFGLELSFAQKMAKGGGPIYLVKFSASGMPLHPGWDRNTWKGGDPAPGRVNFYPGTEPEDPAQGALYRQMTKRFREAIDSLEKQGHTPKVRAFLWMQGEQDSKHEVSATTYAKSLALLFQRVKTDVESTGMKLVYGQVLPYEKAQPRFTHREQIRAQMAAADARSGKPESIPDAFMVSTDDCSLKQDTVHHDSAGYWRLGQKFADALLGKAD